MNNTHTMQLAKAICTSNPKDNQQAMTLARKAFIDFFACALGGSQESSVNALLQVFASNTSNNHATAALIGLPQKTDKASAALINGYMGHVLDFDDVQASIRGHPTTVIIPALLAIIDDQAIRADDFIAAYIVGLETMARMGLAMGSTHYEKGFHATATLGVIGAAAAIAYLLKFDCRHCAIALGQAASQASGLRLQFGTDTKPLHAGLAARAGVTAALLTKAGLHGSDDFIDNKLGFLNLYAFDQGKPSLTYENFGKPWQIIKPGLTFKPFPCCTASFPVAMGALECRKQGINANDIVSIDLTFPPGGDAALVCYTPRNGIDARFCPEYIFAIGLIDGCLTIEHFNQQPIRQELATFAKCIKRKYDQSAPRLSADPKTRFVIIDIYFKSGQHIQKRIEGLPNLDNPITKFFDIVGSNTLFAHIPNLINTMKNEAELQTLISSLSHFVKPSKELSK